MSEAWIALIGTLFGGGGFKLIEHFLSRAKTRTDVASGLRNELYSETGTLRNELGKLRQESDELRDEIDEWREKYYSLVGYIASGDLQAALRKIKEGK